MEHMYSQQLMEQFRAGRKEFSNIFLQFCEINSTDLSGIVFNNSKIEYARFWFSNMKGVKFVNCDIYFSGFYCANLENAVFENCTIDMTRFDGAEVKNTKMTNSKLSYCLATNLNLGEIDFHGSSRFKMITNPDSITDEDVADAIKIIGNRTEDLPIEIKSAILKRGQSMAEKFNKDPKGIDVSASKKSYATRTGDKSENLYHAINSFTDEIIKYGSSEIYKSRKKDIYKN